MQYGPKGIEQHCFCNNIKSSEFVFTRPLYHMLSAYCKHVSLLTERRGEWHA